MPVPRLGHVGHHHRQLTLDGTPRLGTMTFGNEADEATSKAIVDRFLDAGGNFVDTANVYSGGVSEEITGRALGSRRDEVVLATKVRFPMGDGPNDVGLSRRNIRTQVEASLRRLGTDWIDLYQVHCWDPRTPLEETLSTLNDLVHEGKVRYLGASNFAGLAPGEGARTRALHDWEPFVSLQPEYSLITRDIERELLPQCRRGSRCCRGARSAGGVLSGKYRKDSDFPAGTRGAETENPITFTYRLDDRAWNIVDAVGKVAAEVGKTPAQVALNWVLQPTGRHRADHRRPQPHPARGQPRRGRLAAREAATRRSRWASAFRLGYPYEFIQFADPRAMVRHRDGARTGRVRAGTEADTERLERAEHETWKGWRQTASRSRAPVSADGWRSLLIARASIWRIRSRVRLKYSPTSSSVRGSPRSRPNRNARI